MNLKITRTSYYTTASILVIVGLILGIASYITDVGNYSQVLTVGSSQTQVDIETSNRFVDVFRISEIR